MKNILPVLFAVLTVSFFSCKKDDAINKNTEPVPVKDTPVLLTRMLILDTTSAAPNDTFCIYNISYDANFRPATVEFIVYEYQPVSNYKSIVSYEYQGTDSVASKTTSVITSIYNGVTTISHDTMYYYYHDGKLMSDSLRGNDGGYYRTHFYNYLSDHLAVDYTSIVLNPYNETRGSYVFYQSFSNGNLSAQHDTLMNNYITNGSTLYLADQYTISYLNNPDPYYKVIKPIRRPYFNEDDWVWDAQPSFCSPNLPSVNQHNNDTWGGGGTGAGTNTSVYQYSFRADGYPLVMYQAEHEIGPYDRYFKIIYSYNR